MFARATRSNLLSLNRHFANRRCSENMVIRSQENDVHIDDSPFHHQILIRAKSYGPSVTALTDADTAKNVSYKELYDKSYALATYIGNLGAVKGDVACICLPNCIEYPIIFLGVAIVGGVTSGANPEYNAEELRHHFSDSGCKFIFTSSGTYDKVRAACKNLPVEYIFVLGSQVPPQARSLSDIITKTVPNYFIDDGVKFLPEDTLILPYSSGTTGQPKGVIITHRNMSAETAILKAAVFDKLTSIRSERSTIAFLPFFHGSGFWALCYALLDKHHTIVMPKFHPIIMLQCIEKYKVDTLNVVPPIVAFMARDPIVERFDLKSVKIVLSGAGSLGKDLSDKFVERFPHVTDLLQGYGMTEVVVLTHLTPVGLGKDARLGSCGKLLPNFEARLDGPYQRGELWVRSPSVMKGYLNKPDATKETIDENGWLRTGDIVYYDNDGFFFVVDRLKELIKVRGLQVSPSELDAVLMSHPDVADASVIGVPDLHSGEVPRAFVVKKEGVCITEAQIQDYVRDKVSPHKQLLGGVFFVDELPKTPSGKTLRRLLRNIDINTLTKHQHDK